MVASLFKEGSEAETLARLLEPEPTGEGVMPEQRLIVCGSSWGRYLEMDRALGADRPGPRLYYLDGDLEVITTSIDHERIKKWISGLLDLYFDHAEIEVMPRGSATMRLEMKKAGAEPDESWCLHQEKQWPDVVLEIALTSGGVKKLEIYQRFAIPEVWIWENHALHIFGLDQTNDRYEPIPRSRLLPGLDMSLLSECVSISSWREARQTFREGLAKA